MPLIKLWITGADVDNSGRTWPGAPELSVRREMLELGVPHTRDTHARPNAGTVRPQRLHRHHRSTPPIRIRPTRRRQFADDVESAAPHLIHTAGDSMPVRFSIRVRLVMRIATGEPRANRGEGARSPGTIDQSAPESSDQLRFGQITRPSNYGFTSRTRIRSTFSPVDFTAAPSDTGPRSSPPGPDLSRHPERGSPRPRVSHARRNRRIRGTRATVFESAKHFRRVRDDRHTSDIAQ